MTYRITVNVTDGSPFQFEHVIDPRVPLASQLATWSTQGIERPTDNDSVHWLPAHRIASITATPKRS